jgi:predicted ArsR family transcriptional regulator
MERERTSAGHLDGARVHRALSSSVRTRLLRLLLEPGHRGAVADVRSLAAALGLHVNTVRAHLAVLEDAGLVRSEPEDRERPGRPRLVYRPTVLAAEVAEPAAVAGISAERGYRFLAQVLAGHLAASAVDPAAEATAAGAAWGRYLVERPAPYERLDAAAGLARVVALLAEFGFDPELTGADGDGSEDGDEDRAEDGETGRRPADGGGAPLQLALHRCPFAEVAKAQGDVVCSIHLGLMRGALDELGVDVGVRDLRPFVRPDLCVAVLEVGRSPAPERPR